MLFQIIFVCVLLNYTSTQEAVLTKEYKLETYFKTNWFGAYEFCRDHKMQLATVNTEYEQQTIHQLPLSPAINEFGEYENYWISATDLAEDGNYKWFSTGKALSFVSWASGQPAELYQNPLAPKIDNTEDCVQIMGDTQTWGSANCSNTNYFICEYVF